MDPLATLGLGRSAGPEEVAAAYRALAKRWHPDVAGSGAQAARRMADVNAAYALLRARAPATGWPRRRDAASGASSWARSRTGRRSSS